MHTILMVIHILVAFALIGIILIQHGRGADTGAAFGSGASSTVFGARGSATFLSRVTAVLAIVFFSNSLFLAYLSSRKSTEQSLMDKVETAIEAPAATDSPPAADTAGNAAALPGAADRPAPDDAPPAVDAATQSGSADVPAAPGN